MSYRKINPLPPIKERTAKRFWSHVTIGDEKECWIWNGSRSHQGYGKLGITVEGRFHHCKATRIAYFLGHGRDPHPLCVLHKCDNPPCVNPAHLFPGTDADNTADMLAKRRFPCCKLTPEMVDEIRARLKAGQSQTSVASHFGVTQQTIADIHIGRNWKNHISHHTNMIDPALVPQRKPNRYLTVRGETKTISEWARHQGVSASLIQMRLGRGWSADQAIFHPLVVGRPR